MVGSARTRLPYPSAQPVYAAARLWRDRSLVDDLSLFGPDRIATAENAEVLIRDFVNQPDAGKDSFLTKLRGQLSASPPAAVRLAAELLYVHFLIARSTTIGGQKKAEHVRAVLSFVDGPNGVDHEHDIPTELVSVLSSGVINPGQGYSNYRWRQFAYLIQTVAELKRLPDLARRRAVTEPAAFVEFLDEFDDSGAWIQRFALEHLLFPDVFAPVAGRSHRQRILATWPELAGDPTQPESFRLGAVADGLAANETWNGTEFVNFYRAPHRWEWREIEERWSTLVQWGMRLRESVDLAAMERDYKHEGAEALAKARRSGSTEDLRSALRGLNLVDWRVADTFLRWVADTDDAPDVLRKLWTDPGPESVDRFLDRLPESAVAGGGARLSLASTLLGAVDVTSLPPWRARAVDTAYRLAGHAKPEPSASNGERYALFLVFLDQLIDAFARAGIVLANRLEAQSLMWALMTYDAPEAWTKPMTDAFLEWRQGHGTAPPTTQDLSPSDDLDQPVERSMSDLADELYLEESFLDTIVQLLREKKQIIVQGSPGTGKTHVARAVATWFAGSPDRVRLVQFHPTYAYEDFVEGFRPSMDDNGFRLVDGPLVEIAEKADGDRNNTYVLVIDELNRGNVARVFGELYFLLEYRDEPARLLYREKQFRLPPNLFLIGTMNTVDRSIALLDSALRRRFYFVNFQPDAGPVADVLRRYLQAKHPDYVWVADAVAAANRRIADPDAAIGPSHFFRKDDPIDDAWLEMVWEHAIMPTLREHFHGRPDRLPELGLAELRPEVTQPDDDTPAS